MSYCWVIDKDHIDDGASKGVFGPSRVSLCELEERLNEDSVVKWRAYDDDGELYYEGRWVGEDKCGLGPLTDFCMPNAGCTRIELFEHGKWSVL